MKSFFTVLQFLIRTVALLIFASGIVLVGLGCVDFVKAFGYLLSRDEHATSYIAIGLLHAVDAFLVATVFFVMSLGLWVLFHNPEVALSVKLPEWLRIKNFTELKIILWEAILTTLVVSFIARLAEMKIRGEELNLYSLIIPGIILIIAISLFFLKKGGKHE